jgi:hypothetical protein
VSQLMMVRIAAFSGCNQTTPLDVAVITDGNVAASTFAAPSITPVSSGAMAVWVFSTPDDNTLNAASQGTTAFSDSSTTGSDGSLALVYELQTAAAPTGTTSLTQSANGPDNWNSIVLALRPAAPVTANPSTALYDGVTFAVEIAFSDSPYAPSPTWTDVSAYVRTAPGLSIQQFRQSEFSDTQPGTLSLTLANQDRRFDPDYSSSPYYGNLKPLKRIRVRARYNSVNYSLFDGFIQSWPQRYQGNSDAYVEIEAIDLFGRLANLDCPETDLRLAVLSDSPAAYWPFGDEGFARDLSGNGGDAVVNVATLLDTFLDGEPGRSSQVITTFDNPLPASIFTAYNDIHALHALEAWVYVDAHYNDPGLLGTTFFTLTGCSTGIQMTIDVTVYDTFGVLNMTVNDGFGVDEGIGVALSVARGYHVAMVVNSALSLLSVYIDGALIGSTSVSALDFENGAMSGFVNIQGHRINARFAHVALYDEELSATRIAAHYQAGVSGGLMETAGDRMDKLADYAGLVDAELYTSATVEPNTYLGRAEYSGSVLAEMQLVNQSERGRLYVSGSGVLTFQGRQMDWSESDTRYTTSQATIGDTGVELHYPDIELEPATLDLVRNAVEVNFTGGTVAVRDQDAIDTLGAVVAETIDTSLVSADAAKLTAQARLRRYATPASRVSTITLVPRKIPATFFPVVLALAPGTRLTVRRRPQAIGSAIEKVVQVEGIEHSFDGGQWATTLYLAPSHDTYTAHPWFKVGDNIGTASGRKVPA